MTKTLRDEEKKSLAESVRVQYRCSPTAAPRTAATNVSTFREMRNGIEKQIRAAEQDLSRVEEEIHRSYPSLKRQSQLVSTPKQMSRSDLHREGTDDDTDQAPLHDNQTWVVMDSVGSTSSTPPNDEEQCPTGSSSSWQFPQTRCLCLSHFLLLVFIPLLLLLTGVITRLSL